MNSRLITAVISIVVLGGGVVGFLVYRAGTQVDDRRAKVMRSATAEIESDPVDHDSARRALAQVDELLATEPHPELVRAKARLQLILGRAAAAWETIGNVAAGPSGTIDDRWVAALVAARLHAEVGERRTGIQALEFALECADAWGNVESTFLAWQLAYRVDDFDRWVELTKVLRGSFPEMLEAQTATAIEHFLATHIAQRKGIEVTRENLERVAGQAADSVSKRLAQHVLDTAGAAGELTSAVAERLFRQWGSSSPPEFLVIRARASIGRAGQPGGGQSDLAAAAEELEQVLAQFPTFVEARHLMSLAQYGLLQIDQQNAHLRWLVENASPDDVRQRSWRERLQ